MDSACPSRKRSATEVLIQSLSKWARKSRGFFGYDCVSDERQRDNCPNNVLTWPPFPGKEPYSLSDLGYTIRATATAPTMGHYLTLQSGEKLSTKIGAATCVLQTGEHSPELPDGDGGGGIQQRTRLQPEFPATKVSGDNGYIARRV